MQVTKEILRRQAERLNGMAETIENGSGWTRMEVREVADSLMGVIAREEERELGEVLGEEKRVFVSGQKVVEGLSYEKEMRQELQGLRRALDFAGGRGVELAERIDELQALGEEEGWIS